MVILDPNLDGAHGHHALYDRVIAREFRRRGVEALILSNERFSDDMLDGTPVKALFKTTAYRAFSSAPLFAAYDDVEQGNRAVYAELSATPSDLFRRTDLVVVHTVSEITLVGLVTWIASLRRADRPCFCIFLMLPAGIGRDSEGTLQVEKPAATLAYREAFRIVREHQLDVHFFGSGPQHARQFSELAGVEIPAHPILTTFDETPPRVEPQDDRVLLFAGDAKVNKGVDKLPGVVAALCPAHPDLRFMIHANPEPAWGAALDAVNALRAMAGDYSNLDLDLAPLSGEAYADLIGSAATVLLPYDRQEYRRKSSGVVWEAIASGSTLVTPAETWLDSECRLWGASHESYAAPEPECMAEAVVRALDADRAARAEAAERFTAANGVKAMVDQLTDRWLSAGSWIATGGGETSKTDAPDFAGPGWHDVESVKQTQVRWSSGAATVSQSLPGPGTWMIEFAGVFSFSEDQVSNARILVNGEALDTRWTRSDDGAWTLSAAFEEEDAETPAREITLQPGWVMTESDDPRPLGLLTMALSIAPAEAGWEGVTREPAVPVFGFVAPGPDGWTEPLTAASYTARAHPGCALTVRFAVRNDGKARDPAGIMVFINGQPVQPYWNRTGGFDEARCELPAPPAPVWDSVDLEILSADPVRIKMEKLEWRSAGHGDTPSATETEPPLDPASASPAASTVTETTRRHPSPMAKTVSAPPTAPDPSLAVTPQTASTPVIAARDVPGPIAEAAQAALDAGLKVSCVEDRSGEAHASVTLEVSGYCAWSQNFSKLYIKLLSGKGYFGVELRENDGALPLLRGLSAASIGVDQYGGYVRFFLNPDTGEVAPSLSDIASDGRPLVSLLFACTRLIEQGMIDGLTGRDWLEPTRAVTAVLAGIASEVTEVICTEDRSGELHASVTLEIKGLQVDGRTLPCFFLRLLKGEGYGGLELRESDGAFVLLPGVNRDEVDADDWGPYVRVFADTKTGKFESTNELPNPALLNAAVKAVDDALAQGKAGVDGEQWRAALRAAPLGRQEVSNQIDALAND